MNGKPFSEILQRAFGSAPPPPAPEPEPAVQAPQPEPEAPPKPRGRSIGDPRIAAEAQRIYKPDLPPAPAKAAQGQGVSSSLDLEGAWGKPEAKA